MSVMCIRRRSALLSVPPFVLPIFNYGNVMPATTMTDEEKSRPNRQISKFLSSFHVSKNIIKMSL